MKKIYLLLLFIGMMMALPMAAQKKGGQWQDVRKVKKQETVFGIAKEYGITIDELMDANPQMKEADFVLKKGMKLNIPFAKPKEEAPKPKPVDPLTQRIRMGVMLPLHNDNGDGKRMIEFYRGMLMAVQQLKREGYVIDVKAWNVQENEDIRITLLNEGAKQCDIIFGPLYTPQVPALAEFCKANDIKMVIPFSINATDVKTCDHVYQVYQPASSMTQETILQYLQTFKDYHTVIIDCNDQTSKKGEFTFGLRKHLDEMQRTYNITNLTSSTENFYKAFSTTQRNMVILNTGRSQELGLALQKLELMKSQYPDVQISMFGYNEWYLYMKPYQQKLRKFDTYIPSYYNYNEQSQDMQLLEQSYQANFKVPMQKAVPRFAVTGYDQVMYFLRGMHKYGHDFHGLKEQQDVYTPVQTTYTFQRVPGGGYQNTEFLLVHFH